MKIKFLLLIGLVFLSFSCNKDDDTLADKIAGTYQGNLWSYAVSENLEATAIVKKTGDEMVSIEISSATSQFEKIFVTQIPLVEYHDDSINQDVISLNKLHELDGAFYERNKDLSLSVYNKGWFQKN